jgi:hypothetical protein
MTALEQVIAYGVWFLAIGSAGAVYAIGFVEIGKQNAAREAAAAAPTGQESTLSSWISAMVVGGMILGTMIAGGWTCGLWSSLGVWSWALVVAGVAATGFGGVIAWQKEVSNGMAVCALGLTLIGSTLVPLVLVGKEACERSEQPAPAVAPLSKRFGDNAVIKGATNFHRRGRTLAHEMLASAAHPVGIRLTDGPVKSHDVLAREAAESTTVFGVVSLLCYMFLLQFAILGLRHWMARSTMRYAAGLLLLISALVLLFPVGMGLLGLAVASTVMPAAALSFWIAGVILGIVVGVFVVIRTSRSSRRLAAEPAMVAPAAATRT